MLADAAVQFIITVSAEFAVRGFSSAVECIRGCFRHGTRDDGAEQVCRLMRDIGALSEEDIRHLVDREYHAGRIRIAENRREELINLLRTLPRRSRAVTSRGTVMSTYMQWRDVLEVVASNLEPARKIGQEVGPGYEWQLERVLGIGSFGEVWMCRNLRDHDPDRAGRNCRAFKFFSSVEGANWIEREANSLFEIQDKLPDGHPNIVKFYSVAVAEQPYPLLEFEYVSDGSLEDWIVADQRMRRTLDVTQIVRDVVEGLAAAHEAGIYHRDVKPANILLTAGPNPSAKVTDFGLGTIPNRPLGTATACSLGATTGTQLYLPPEAAEPFAAIDSAQQDVFAVGVVWYQLCVNRLERPPYNFAQQLITSGADSHSIELISTCLAHPETRFSSAVALRERLVDIVPPDWDVPEGRYDVQHIFREYLAATF